MPWVFVPWDVYVLESKQNTIGFPDGCQSLHQLDLDLWPACPLISSRGRWLSRAVFSALGRSSLWFLGLFRFSFVIYPVTSISTACREISTVLSSVKHSHGVTTYESFGLQVLNVLLLSWTLDTHLNACVHFLNSLLCLHMALGNLGLSLSTFWSSRKERGRQVFTLQILRWFHCQLLCRAEDTFYLFSSNNDMTLNITEALYNPQIPLLHICHY